MRRLGEGDPLHLWDKFWERDYDIVLSFIERPINEKRRRYDFVQVRDDSLVFQWPGDLSSVGLLLPATQRQ
jgi:hypothetical protein